MTYVFLAKEEDLTIFQNQMRRILKIKDFGKPRQFQGIELTRARNKEVSFRQLTLIDNLLKENGMKDYKPIDSSVNPDIGDKEVRMAETLSEEKQKSYRSIVGSLLYIVYRSRPDLAFAASVLGSYIAAPTTVYMIQAKRAMRCLRSTLEKIFKMEPGASKQLSAYVDASWRASTERKSSCRTGILIYFCEALIHATSFAQKRVIFSSTESEIVAPSKACRLLAWLRETCNKFGVLQNAAEVFQDNAERISWTTGGSIKQFALLMQCKLFGASTGILMCYTIALLIQCRIGKFNGSRYRRGKWRLISSLSLWDEVRSKTDCKN